MRALLLLSLLFFGCADAPADAAEARRYAVRLAEEGSEELAEAVLGGSFNRWVVPGSKEVELAVGPTSQTTGDVEVTARLLPGDGSIRAAFLTLPIHVGDGAIFIAGTAYRDPRHALAVRLPKTARPSWVVVGGSVDAVASLVDQVLAVAAGVRFRRTPEAFDYLLRENPWTVRSGRWQIGEDGRLGVVDTRDDFAAREATYAALQPIRRAWAVLEVPAEQALAPEMQSLANTLSEAVRTMVSRIPLKLEEPVRIVVEEDFVAQGRHLGDIGPAVLEPATGDLHLVFHPRDLFAYHFELARMLLRRELPHLVERPWLELGAALWLSRDWYGRPYEDWVHRFAAAGVLPSAEELLAEERQGDSSRVLWPPVAAAVIDRLEGETLKDKLRAPPSLAGVRSALANLPGPGPKVSQVRKAASSGGFRKGISFAMANGLDSGYHAPGVDGQLERLRQLGADSVSLMPFAYQRHPGEPRLSFLNRHPTSETDVGVIHAARRAHAQGLRVLWKPHIWVSHDSWPGEIEMAGDADWEAWWRSYRRYVLHHAVLAEWTRSELFSVGVELGRTVSHERQWRRLIAGVRGVYSGGLTYSGNWAGDYDQVGFWDALDFVGVDAYFPLSDSADADRAALAEGARRTARVLRQAAERFGKPVLLTEVGFAAREGAWTEPHQEGGTLSEAHQEMAYEALLGALGHPPWLAGVFFWKAFSHPDGEGHGRPDFRFLGRGAEDVVRGYFRPRSEASLTSPQ